MCEPPSFIEQCVSKRFFFLSAVTNNTMTQDQKLELGIEIVAAMKASAYEMSIEDGRIMALQDTELDRLSDFTVKEFENLEETFKRKVQKFQELEKERLHNQAFFVAEIALEKLAQLNVC
jgi:uncharacterized protein (DUF885 family)